MSKEVLLNLICGDNEECREELLNIPKELNSFLESSQLTPSLKSFTPPLLKQVENLGDYEALVGDQSLGQLIVARKLASMYGGSFRGWSEDYCPICGRRPQLFLVRKVNSAFFEGKERVARCVCGFTWRYKWWRCPNCGVEGRENFDVFVNEKLEGIFFNKCRRCGFVHVEAYGEVDEVAQYALRILANHVA